ncbi:hypothetical protein ACFL6H_00575 [Candidatus Latescibacterota bacterium]
MRKSITMFIPLLIVSMFFSGCLVTSIHPLGNEDDIVFDENLIGAWIDDEDLWIFTKGEENSYKLILVVDDDNDKNEEFIAKLVKLGDKLFLDICPERLDSGNIIYDVLMFPAHTFLRYSLDSTGLSLGFNDPDWFGERIDNNIDIGIDYVITEDEVITLTAPTEMLQKFYLENADRSGFFDLDDEKLQRRDVISVTFIDDESGEKFILKGVDVNGETKWFEKSGLKSVDVNGVEVIITEPKMKLTPKPVTPKKPLILPKPEKPLIRVKPEKPEKRLFPPEIMNLEEPVAPKDGEKE